MKKKNLIILLLIPFVISFLSIVTINITFETFNSDLSSIEWNYKDIESFKITDGKYLLEARGVTTSQTPLAPGNNLVWTIENKDSSIEKTLAEIIVENGQYFIKPLAEGEVIITCSNEKGNVFKKMTAILYKDGVVIVQPKILSSQNNIDSCIYYGEYDMINKKKKLAEIDLELTCYPNSMIYDLDFIDITDNIEVLQDGSSVKVKIKENIESLDASFTVKSRIYSTVAPSTFSFKIVPDGVNVYDYETLLACTNHSKAGEIVVLRKSFIDKPTYSFSDKNNIELFGGSVKDGYNFKNDVYTFKTTYNSEFIKDWNSFAYSNKNYKEVSTTVVAALRVQKDFYGNGYSLNFHNLTYPSTTRTENGITYPVVLPTDMYKGGLPFYSLGDPNALPIVTAYGQDNVGMLIDNENVMINDVNISNCNTPSSLSFFNTVGTVVEVNADDVTIKNCRIQNGKNVVRSFSAMNLKIENSLLSTAMNFLISTGSNEYLKIDDSKMHSFTNFNGEKINATLKTYLNKNIAKRGNDVLNNYLRGTYTDKEAMKESVLEIQKALDYGSESIKDVYKGSMTIEDVYFYNSGISSICIENYFNGPFLYNATPTEILDKFATAGDMTGKALLPYTPINISGIAYPVEVNITGDTKFFDYKLTDKVYLGGLIKENISSIASEILGQDFTFDIDLIFPLKSLLVKEATKEDCIYVVDGQNYVNVPIAYYGGGINLSTVNYTGELYDDRFVELKIDLLENYLDYQGSGQASQYLNIMLKSVTVVTGFEPFKFVCVKADGYLFNEKPLVSDLISNAKGE